MSTTKPPRRRTGHNTHTAARQAPSYRRLADDAYAALDELEKLRHDLHLDIDAIIDATPYAELDQRAIGFPSTTLGGRGGGGDPGALNSVEAASQAPDVDRAVSWLAEARETRAHIIRAANLGRLHYGFDPAAGRPEPGRPRGRRGEVGVCVFCGDPAPAGRDQHGRALNRTVDGRIVIHARPCYETAAKQAARLGVSVGAHLSNLSNTETAGRTQEPRRVV